MKSVDTIVSKISYRLRPLYYLYKYSTNDFFSFVSIETSTTCNRRCPYCPNSKFDRSLPQNEKLLSASLFYKLVDELAELNFKGIFSPNLYGEPLLDARFVQLMQYTRSKLPDTQIYIFTNGDFLTIDLYKSLVKVGGRIFFIVTQHPGKEPDNVKKVIEYRRTRGDDGIFLCYKKLDTIYSRGGLIHSGVAMDPKSCRILLPEVAIDCEGNTILCCNDYFSSVILGNIRNERLIDIWKKPRYKLIRNQIKKGVFTLEICKKCIGETVESFRR